MVSAPALGVSENGICIEAAKLEPRKKKVK